MKESPNMKSANIEVLRLMELAVTLAKRDEAKDPTGAEMSDEYNLAVTASLDSALADGWNWESDDTLFNYCLKASALECSEATLAAYLKATTPSQIV